MTFLGFRPQRTLPAIVLFVALCLIPVVSLAASQEDEDACRPDVFRLCASAIPSEDAIVACLNVNSASLSPACRAVMTPSKPSTPLPRRRRTVAQ